MPHTATVTSITGVNGETGATVGTVTLNTTHTNAGTYASDSWSFTGTANYNNIASTTITDTINKANATVVVTPYTVTYDGNPHTATVTSITGVNGETGATVGTVTLNTTHTNAGTYASDSWSFTGTANYNNIASTTITDTINKATATVVVTPYTVTYDGHAAHGDRHVDHRRERRDRGHRRHRHAEHDAHERRHLRQRLLELHRRRQLQQHRQHDDHRHHQQGQRDGRGHALHRDLRRQCRTRRPSRRSPA